MNEQKPGNEFGTIEIADDKGNTIKIVYAPNGVQAGICVGATPHISINGHMLIRLTPKVARC